MVMLTVLAKSVMDQSKCCHDFLLVGDKKVRTKEFFKLHSDKMNNSEFVKVHAMSPFYSCTKKFKTTCIKFGFHKKFRKLSHCFVTLLVMLKEHYYCYVTDASIITLRMSFLMICFY